jgi:plastocyanin
MSTPTQGNTSQGEQQTATRRPSHRRRIILIAVAIVVLLAAGFYISSAVSQAMRDQQTQAALHGTPVTQVTIVNIVGYEFQPANLQVAVGTTITWINKDNVAHTVTFKNGMQDSGMIQPGASYRYTFTKPGTFAYDCAVHPNMVAQVIVTP